jgi:N-acetyl-gamma-glutamyl-phosphate reductase
MGARAAVIGASGYAGGELIRLLAGHPDVELGAVTADGNAGRAVTQVHPNLAGVPDLAGRSFETLAGSGVAGCDLAFLALPAGESAAVAGSLPADTKVIDLGPDFRLADPSAWARHYQGTHAGRWTAGLPELPGARAKISRAERVAVPGCYATASVLALAPLLAAGLVEPGDVVIVAASGTSGAGRALKPELLGSEVMGAVSAYQVGGTHRHVPEIEQALAEVIAAAGAGAGGERGVTVSFTPVLAPMPRGILATCTARLAGGAGTPAADTAALRQALGDAYAAEPFAWLLPEGSWPSTAAVAGSNAVHLQAAADRRSGRAVVVAAIDNLGKGAAGQALQNANLMLGLPETAGLSACGVAP